MKDRTLASPITRGKLAVSAQTSAQHPVRQRTVDEDSNVVGVRLGQYRAFYIPTQEVVRGLEGLDAQIRTKCLHLDLVKI